MEIHSKHWLFGYPLGTPATNDLIIRDIYALSSNDATKLADWVAYRLTMHEVGGTLDLKRKWGNDPWLAEDETLEGTKSNDDYKNASSRGYDRGHQAPLASFKGTRYASQTNLMSNITPQQRALNQGPWKNLEEGARKLVRTGKIVWVVTGPYYGEETEELTEAGEPNKIPSGYWKIVAIGDRKKPKSIRAVAFIMAQNTARRDKFTDHIKTIDEVETLTGLDFFWELPDAIEEVLESVKGTWPLTESG